MNAKTCGEQGGQQYEVPPAEKKYRNDSLRQCARLVKCVGCEDHAGCAPIAQVLRRSEVDAYSVQLTPNVN